MPDGSQIPLAAEALEAVLRGLGESLGSPVDGVVVNHLHQRVYSRLADCHLRLRSGERRRVMVKVYQSSRGSGGREALAALVAKDFQITTHLHRLFADRSQLRVPVPLFHSPDDLVIVTAHMPGRQLQDKLVAQGRGFPGEATVRDLESDCRRCGEWLRAFQQGTRSVATGTVDLAAMRGMIADRLEWSVDSPSISLDEAERREILAHFDAVAGTLRPTDLEVSGVHGDFFPGNVLVGEREVVGLDFAMYRVGSVYADPSYFVFQLETLGYKPQYRRALVARLRSAFLEGYEPRFAARDFFTAHPMLRLHLVLHLAMRLGGIFAARDAPLHRRVYNRFISRAVIAQLLRLARDRSRAPESPAAEPVR